MATYDAVKWHILTKQKVPLNVAVIHFRAILDWLNRKKLLTDLGKQQSKKIDRNFELTSDMVTELGNAVLIKGYSAWVQTIDYKSKPKMNLLDRLYSLLKNKISDDDDTDNKKTSDLNKQVQTTYNSAIDNSIVKTATTGPQNNPNMVQPVTEEIIELLQNLLLEIDVLIE